MRGLVADGTTALLTTQYLDEADRLAAQIAVLDHGRVIANDSPAALKAKVGGQTLEVRPAERSKLDAAAAIVAQVAGATPTRNGDGGLVSVPVRGSLAGSQALAAVARRLDAAGIAVTEAGLRLASLDEVFLALTGHPTQESEEQEQ